MGPHPTPGLPCLGSERGMEEGREFRMKLPLVLSNSQVPIPFVALSVSPVSLPARIFSRTDSWSPVPRPQLRAQGEACPTQLMSEWTQEPLSIVYRDCPTVSYCFLSPEPVPALTDGETEAWEGGS